MSFRGLAILTLLAVSVLSMQGCAWTKSFFARKDVYVASSPSAAPRFLAYQAEPGVFKSEMRVRPDVLWKAALALFRSADILESNPNALTLRVRYHDEICSLSILPKDERSSAVELKITDYNGSSSYNLWGRKLLKKLYNKSTSLSFATVRKFSDDDGK